MLRRVVLTGTVFTLAVAALSAQQETKLAEFLPGLYGPGITLADPSTAGAPSHRAHFQKSSQDILRQFNTSVMTQLTALPLSSPASGFTYVVDPTLGTMTRSAQSFGPILAERAETIGKNRVNIGFSYQHFGFDKLEGRDLDSVTSVFRHDDVPDVDLPLEHDLITTTSNIDLAVDEFTVFVTYGLADSVDVSVAMPIVRSDLRITSTGEIQRIGSGAASDVHRFSETGGATNSWSTAGTASGIGDILFRGKATVMRWEHGGVAVAADLRLPTGDEENLLGSGAVGVKPFAAVSLKYGIFSPHVNLGYQWNGDSKLAGDVITGIKGNLPDQFLFTGGVDVGFHPRVTVAFDLLGQRIIDSQRITWTSVTAGNQTFPDFGFRTGSFNMANGAAGVKLNPFSQVLVDLSLIFAIDDNGLRDTATPLVGVSYNF
ncbi:MAG: transporter [Acidobacteriota bacterium]